MSPKRDGITVHIELVPNDPSPSWGWTFAMDGMGGSGSGGKDQLAALQSVYRHIRREVRRAMETRAEKADRLAKRKDAIARAKSKGLIP